MTSGSSPPQQRAPLPKNAERIVGECRDRLIARALETFGKVLDRVAAVLIERAGATRNPDESVRLLSARRTVCDQRHELVEALERALRVRVDQRLAADVGVEQDFFRLDATKLALVDPVAVDEAVLTGNIRRSLENAAHDELVALNQGIGRLLGKPDLETDDNPLAPETVVAGLADALRAVVDEEAVKLAILRSVNQTPLKDIAGVYADVNRLLVDKRVMPADWRPAGASREGGARPRSAPPRPEGKAATESGSSGSGELDLMSLFRELRSGAGRAGVGAGIGAGMGFGAGAVAGSGAAAAGAGIADPGSVTGWLQSFQPPVAGSSLPSLPPTPSGYVPGAPIMASTGLGEGLSRLQAGESGFAISDGTQVAFAGIPETSHNVLRDLQGSDLGRKVNQLEAMTIELVAAAFDFVFETRDLPDGIKALLARLQIPVLKAAMLDGAFFARKSHPARLLINALGEAGRGWSPTLGHDDPLYGKISEIVFKVLDGFTDNLAIFEEQRAELERFLAEEAPTADANLQQSAEEVESTDRRQLAPRVVRDAIEQRLGASPVPNFVAGFVRTLWTARLEDVYAASGDTGQAWDGDLATIDDLVWSVQPKRSKEDRKRLVTLLPGLLKRLNAGVAGRGWADDERQRFMENLVEAHAAAVRPGVTSEELPTEVVAEQAKAEAAQAQAAGDEAAAAQAAQRAQAMARAEPAPPPQDEPEPSPVVDEFFDLARDLQRGTWVEFEGDDGQLAFARLAWVSPLRGTYLFTNRLGRKALSMTAAEVAELFRTDRARCVEAEPLLDQAFTTVLTNLSASTGTRRQSA